MTYASVLVTEDDGSQREVCRVVLHNGRAVPSNDSFVGRMIVDSPVWLDKYGRLTAKDGERFLEALQYNYSGTRLRVSAPIRDEETR